MALAKTTFTGTTQAANAPEILAYLQANATEYFDTITADATGNVECKIGQTTVLKLGFDNSTSSAVTLLNGTTEEAYNNNDWFTYAIKTASGIYLNSWDYGAFFITKSDKGTTAVCWERKDGTNTYKYICADFTYSPDFYVLSQGSWGAIQSAMTKQAPLTSLAPIVCYGECYMPNLFVATYSEYAYTKGIFTIGNTQYVSDGAIMLKD